jgi:ABC-2 type transport system permease protein
MANSLVGIIVMGAAMIGALGVMVYQGKVTFDPWPFVLLWGVLLIPTFLVWSAFVSAVLSITGNRYTTYAIAIGVVILTAWLRFRDKLNWVGNWALSRAVTWTDFGSVAPNASALFWNRLFYLSLLAFLTAVTVRVFWRREHDGGRVVERLSVKEIWSRSRWVWILAIVPATLGIFLHVQVNRGFQSKGIEKREKEYWGRNLATWIEAETPLIAKADLDVTLRPDDHYFKVNGTYALTNPSAAPMPSIPMSIGRHFKNVSWTLRGKEATPEDQAKLCVFKLDPPLAPGDTIEVGFSHDGRFPDGITKNGGGMSEFILPIGVVLTSFGSSFVPMPYFEEGRGVNRDNRMDPKDYAEGFYEGVTRPAFGGGSRFPVRTKITGPSEFQFNGVGVKTSEETHDGLRTVVWETDHPVNFFNVVGGKWAARKGEGTVLYHLPKHTYNVEEMGQALDAARKYYSEWFYPFPWSELKLSEFPALAGYAQGFPTNITFSENIGFLTRSTEKARAAFIVTAHEVAHQWWGNILLPGKGPGGNILSEGMSHFSTILLTGQCHGDEGRIEFLKRIEEGYGNRRQVDSEKPLVWIDGSKAGDETATYDKGGWVFWMLHNLMGEEASFAGLRSFIGHYAVDRDHPVLQDFVRSMRPFAPDSTAYDAFVDQWFFQVVAPQYKIHEPKKAQEGDRWVAQAEVENAGTGVAEVQIAASRGERFPKPEKARSGSRSAGDDSLRASAEAEEPYEDARVSVTLGPGERRGITIPCTFEPARVVVDPDALVLQLDRDAAEAKL